MKGSSRVSLALVCEVCKSRNYKAKKAIRDGSKPLVFKKFCKSCKAHTVHRESK